MMSARKTAARPAIVIMSRMPVPGEVKTRMQPLISPERSADLQRALLLDTLDMVGFIKRTTAFLAFAPAERNGISCPHKVPREQVFQQIGRDLGERILESSKTVLNKGYSPVVIIGSDCPVLQPETIDEAIHSLNSADVCIGPAQDGGYYLIGMKRTISDIFLDIPWGTSEVFDATTQRAVRSGLNVHLLQKLFDIDTRSSLEQLAPILKDPDRSGIRHFPQRTYDWMLKEGFCGDKKS